MTERTCIVVAILCCLLAFATSAHAGCAWVLWSREARAGVVVWTPLDTFESKWYCEELAKIASADFKQQVGGTLKCWPDTVDPCWPKGK